MNMVPIYAPQTESEASVIRSIMEAYEIEFFIQGGGFSTLYPGPVSTSLNTQMLMVAEEQAELAKSLLVSFIQPEDASPS